MISTRQTDVPVALMWRAGSEADIYSEVLLSDELEVVITYYAHP